MLLLIRSAPISTRYVIVVAAYNGNYWIYSNGIDSGALWISNVQTYGCEIENI